ncbi:MAG: hypothetical protein U1E76_01825 [Planctomycetota bacterium]
MMLPWVTPLVVALLVMGACESAPFPTTAPPANAAARAAAPPATPAVEPPAGERAPPLVPAGPEVAAPPAPLAAEVVGPPPPPPRPSVRASLSEFEAAVQGSDIVLRATMHGVVSGEGELPARTLNVGVALTGPSQRPLLSKAGEPLLVTLCASSPTPVCAGVLDLPMEGRVPLAELALLGVGLHQVVPELVLACADGIALSALEQFPYVWVTHSDAGSDGINDARVAAPK